MVSFSFTSESFTQSFSKIRQQWKHRRLRGCSGQKGTDNNRVPYAKRKQYSFFRRNPFFRAEHSTLKHREHVDFG